MIWFPYGPHTASLRFCVCACTCKQLWTIGSPGLATDNPQLHPDRIKLWQDFNHAWLALLQKQKDMVSSRIPPQGGQTLVSKESLKKWAKILYGFVMESKDTEGTALLEI